MYDLEKELCNADIMRKCKHKALLILPKADSGGDDLHIFMSLKCCKGKSFSLIWKIMSSLEIKAILSYNLWQC